MRFPFCYTLAAVMVGRPEFEVFGSVVGSITVFVVDRLALAKLAAQLLLHDDAMLSE